MKYSIFIVFLDFGVNDAQNLYAGRDIREFDFMGIPGTNQGDYFFACLV